MCSQCVQKGAGRLGGDESSCFLSDFTCGLVLTPEASASLGHFPEPMSLLFFRAPSEPQ